MIETEQIFVLVGIILVSFLSFLLLTSKKYKSISNRFLAYALLIITLIVAKINFLSFDNFLFNLIDYLRIEYLFSIFLYLYVFKSLDYKINRKTYILLFSPFVLFSGMYIMSSVLELFNFNGVTYLLEFIEPFEIYIILTFSLIVISNIFLKVKLSNTSKGFKKWMYTILGGLIAVLCSFLISEIIELFFDIELWDYLGIGVSLFFTLITYHGVQQLQVEQELKQIKCVNQKIPKPIIDNTNTAKQSHFDTMKLLMSKEQLFKNSKLDRELLASKLGLSASSVTRILKDDAQISFNDFVNSYRVNLAKEMLQDERFNIFSLDAIGKEVGFKSRSTFYESFKKEVGVAPGKFKKDYWLSGIIPDA